LHSYITTCGYLSALFAFAYFRLQILAIVNLPRRQGLTHVYLVLILVINHIIISPGLISGKIETSLYPGVISNVQEACLLVQGYRFEGVRA